MSPTEGLYTNRTRITEPKIGALRLALALNSGRGIKAVISMIIVGSGRGELFVTTDTHTGSGFIRDRYRFSNPVVTVGAADMDGPVRFGTKGLLAAGAGKGWRRSSVNLGYMLVQAAFLKKGTAAAVHGTGITEVAGVLFHVVKHSRADRLCFTAGGADIVTVLIFDGFVHRREC